MLIGALAMACAVRPAGAQSGLRISEVFFACANDDTTIQYVELVNTGPDTVFVGSLRIQYQRDPLTGQFNFNPGFALSGFPWLHGQHFLIGSANVGPRLGLSPDVSGSQVKLARSGGILTLYTQAGPTLDEIRYGPFGPTVAPADGYSLSRVNDAWLPAPPTPHRRDGALLPGANCFASSAGDFVLTEVMFACRSGLVSGQFMEIGTGGVTRTMTSDVGLRYFDHGGGLLADLPSLFAARIGSDLTYQQALLLGLQGSTALGTVDGTFGVPLDTLGGRIVLYRSRTGGDSVLTDLRYGPDALPMPPPGASLVRNSDSGGYGVAQVPLPLDHDGLTHTIGPDCASPPISSARISEFQLRCMDGDSGGRFVEISLTAPPDEFDPSLSLAAYDHGGALIGRQTDLFGSRAGGFWSTGTPWLLATDVFTGPAGEPPDAPLSLALDPAGGRLELLARRHTDGVEVAVDVVPYGTAEVPAPPLGQSLVRTATGGFVLNESPDPRGISGVYTASADCRRREFTAARIGELQIRCTDGARAGRFVELVPSFTPDEMDSTLAILVYDHAGVLLGEQGDLFGSRTGTAWPNGAHWLVASDAYTSASGLPPDTPFLIYPDTLGGRIELRARSRGTGSLAIVDAVTYGPGGAPVPPPGQSLLRTSSGSFVVAARPTPQGFPSVDYAAPLECRRPRVSSIRIAELGLRCTGGSTAYQFIELAPTLSDDLFEPGLALRAYDAKHTLIGEVGDVFGSRSGQAFTAPGPWFVGSPKWRNTAAQGPETVLPFKLDPFGGTIELWGHDRVTGETAQLQTLTYGTAEVLVPGPAQGLVRTPDGRYALAPASPQGSTLLSYIEGSECHPVAEYPASIQQFSLACASGSVSGQFIEVDFSFSAPYDSDDSSLVVQAYDRDDHLLGTIHVLAESRFAGFQHSVLATRFWQFQYTIESGTYWDYLYDTLLPFVLDPAAGRIVLAARDPYSGDPVIVQDLRYGPGGWPAPPPGSSLLRTAQGDYVVHADPTPRPARFSSYYGTITYNQGCSPAGLDEVFTACQEGTAGVSYVRLAAHTPTYRLGSNDSDGNELRVWGADGALLSSDTVLVLPSAPFLGDHRYLVTSPPFAAELGAAGDHTMHASLDPSGGRVAIGWTTPAGTFDVFDELVYGPGHVPAPAPGRALTRDAGGLWKEGSALPVTLDGRTFHSASCLGSRAWPVVIREVFPSCRCSDGVSFVEFATGAEPTLVELGPTLVALDRLGAERWRMPNAFSARAGLQWPPNQAFLLGSPLAASGILGSNPDGVMPGALDPDGGRLILLGDAGSAPPETLATFSYGAGTPNQRSLRGWSYQRQADGTFAQGFPSPQLFGSASPLFGPGVLSPCIGTGAFAKVDQALWSCTDGSGGVSYIALSTDFGNFPDDMGIRAFGRDGTQLLRIEHPFPQPDCVPIGYNIRPHWLLASAGMEQLCGAKADALMPVPLDAVAGRIETFLVTPRGDTTVQRISYGGASDPVVPPGYALEPGPAERAVDAHPVGSNGRVLRAPSCIEDGPPVVTIAEVFLRCGDGSTEAQYVKLQGGSDPDFHDSRLRLIARDRSGAELFHIDPLAPELEGRALAAGDGLLIGASTLSSRIGLTPDVVLSGTLDADGGSLRLEWVRSAGSTPVVLDDVRYGPGSPLRLQPAGMAIRPHDDLRPDLHFLALPANLAGEHPTSGACFTDSCSAFTLGSSFAAGLHLAYPDSIRGIFRDCGQTECEIATYDWSTLSVSAFVATRYFLGTPVVAYDDFIAEGLPYGTPIRFKVQFTADLYGSHSPPCYDYYCGAYASSAGAAFSIAGVHEELLVDRTLDTTITRSVTVRAGEPFRLVLMASASASNGEFNYGAGGQAEASILPQDLPPGVTLHSCWGYQSPVVVAAEISLASASATRDGVRLEWRTSSGSAFSAVLERRSGDAPWLPLATLLPNGLGALKYEDHDVRAGHAYDYRLRWSDERGGHTSGVVTLTVPDAPRFAFHGAWPNPARDQLSLSLVLDDSGPARVEVFDLSGRRVASQPIALEPGEHVVPLTAGRRLPPGIYSAKLRQGPHTATRRLVIIP